MWCLSTARAPPPHRLRAHFTWGKVFPADSHSLKAGVCSLLLFVKRITVFHCNIIIAIAYASSYSVHTDPGKTLNLKSKFFLPGKSGKIYQMVASLFTCVRVSGLYYHWLLSDSVWTLKWVIYVVIKYNQIAVMWNLVKVTDGFATQSCDFNWQL